MPRRAGFTLVELLVAIAVLGLLAAILLPSLAQAKRAAQRTVCAGSLRALHMAFVLYLESNAQRFFPLQERRPDGVLWYWGFEKTGGGEAEGSRPLDRAQARLAPYFQQTQSIEVCPSVAYSSRWLKPKFNLAGYGYAINYYMLAGNNGTTTWDKITRPGETAAWADAMQLNTFQAPASPTNPLLEDWYYLSNRGNESPNFHFRHQKKCMTAFADSSVRPIDPFWLDGRCDGLVGRPEKTPPILTPSPLLQLDK